jgi:hypothetical protein
MTHFVQVVNGEIKQVWDTPPAEGVGNNGWRTAVEVRPAITAHRQGYTAHRFDLNTSPVQIIWDTYEISVDDRKNGMKSNAGFAFQQVVMEQSRLQLSPNANEQYDATAVETARQAMLTKQAAIDAATTHDQLDALL